MKTFSKRLRAETLDFFIDQAVLMGRIALLHYGNLNAEDITDKPGHIHDPITIADREISRHIVDAVRTQYRTSVNLLTEESAKDFAHTEVELLRRGKPLIVVDELDGTQNFSRGIEHFSIILGLAEPRAFGYDMTVGLIYKPLTREFYFGSVDMGAKHHHPGTGDTTLKVSNKANTPIREIPVNVSIGRETFPKDYPAPSCKVADAMERFSKVNKGRISQVNKFSCGLEIMDVAKGDVDVYMIAKAANWDYATAALLLELAGGKGYLVKSQDMIVHPRPWNLQLEKPGEYYPAIFTNGKADTAFFAHLRGYLSR